MRDWLRAPLGSLVLFLLSSAVYALVSFVVVDDEERYQGFHCLGWWNRSHRGLETLISRLLKNEFCWLDLGDRVSSSQVLVRPK